MLDLLDIPIDGTRFYVVKVGECRTREETQIQFRGEING